MNELTIIETREGCQSAAIATPDFVIRVWMEGDEPPELAGVIDSASHRADRALREGDHVPFTWRGSRAELVALLRTCPPDLVVADPRLALDPAPRIETPEVLIEGLPVSRRWVSGTLEIPFGFAGDWGDLTTLAWGSNLRQILNDSRFAAGERELAPAIRRRADLAALALSGGDKRAC